MSDQEGRASEEENAGGGRTEEAVSNVKDAAGGTGNGLASRVMKKEVLIPVAATAATAIAGIAAKKGGVGGKIKQLGGETAEDVGRKTARGAKEEITGGDGVGGLAAGAASKVFGGGGGGSGKAKTRRLQIQRWTDVAVPVEQAFETWTSFEDYPKFMHRVLSVKQGDDDNTIEWDEKIWFSKRHWEAEIVEQRDNELISWKTTTGASHAGVVSFHRLDDNLTRVMVTMDFRPSGLMEKMASGLRFVKRAVQADLARFKSYVEFQEAGLEAPQERLQQVEQEEKQQKEEKKQEDKQSEDGERARSEEDGQRARSEGDQAEESEDDRDRDSEREERQSRREERREKTTA